MLLNNVAVIRCNPFETLPYPSHRSCGIVLLPYGVHTYSTCLRLNRQMRYTFIEPPAIGRR